MYFLTKKDLVEHIFSPMWKLLMKLELEHKDTYSETFIYMIYRISFSHKYHVEKSTVYLLL
jgi:hypothetical protein